MDQHGKLRRSGPVLPLIRVFALFAVLGLLVLGWSRWNARRPAAERYQLVGVHRTDILPVLTASGRVESSKRTIVECELERIGIGVQGRGIAASGASTLLTIIPEGSPVRRGDVLATLDSSEYEEMVRIQSMTVERSKADQLQAALDYEIAKMALVEFRDGTMQESIEDYQGQITLARSDLERARDRLNWSRNMREKGYVPLNVVTGDEFRVEQCQLALEQLERAFDLFKRFTVPKTITALEGSIKGSKAILDYHDLRFTRNTARLESLKKQIRGCTIRAPHDGFVIYANDTRQQIVIEPGMSVRQRQALMYLPDLSKMEIIAQLHESTVQQVKPGQTASVEVESAPGVKLHGKVVSISPLATLDWKTNIPYFQGIIRLENPPGDLRPGMTAQVQIHMPERQNVLTIPSEAITSDDGLDVCFVVHDDGLERRTVKLGRVTEEVAEVTDGLQEGEQVVLNPGGEDDEELDLDTLPHQIAPTPVATAEPIIAHQPEPQPTEPAPGPAPAPIATLH